MMLRKIEVALERIHFFFFFGYSIIVIHKSNLILPVLVFPLGSDLFLLHKLSWYSKLIVKNNNLHL